MADVLFAQASKKVLATVEHLVSTEQLNEMGVTIPYFYVTGLSEVGYGAHPTACYPFYAYDRNHTADYYRLASQGPETFRENYLRHYVFACRNHKDYLAAVGGEKALQRLASWRHDDETWMALYE